MFVFHMVMFVYLIQCFFFFFQAEDGIRDVAVTGVQTCALPISSEMAIVLNSIGFAPAARMPALSGAASSRRPKLQGMVSSQQLDTPTNGFSMSSAVRPIACRNERAAARSLP